MRIGPESESAAPALAEQTRLLTLKRPVRAAGWLTGCAALVLSIFAAISLGAVAMPLGTVWGVLLDRAAPGLVEPHWSAGRAAIVWDIRLPRALLAALVGAGLALVGAVLQSVTRNPLADPHLLGISSGGAFGAILALLHTGRPGLLNRVMALLPSSVRVPSPLSADPHRKASMYQGVRWLGAPPRSGARVDPRVGTGNTATTKADVTGARSTQGASAKQGEVSRRHGAG